jgi:hypothetical protein
VGAPLAIGSCREDLIANRRVTSETNFSLVNAAQQKERDIGQEFTTVTGTAEYSSPLGGR